MTNSSLQPGVDYIGVTCVFACHDGAGRLLMLKRSANARDEQGRWDVGGGKLEFGEEWEQAVRREVREEYGADPISIEHIHTYNTLRVHNGQPTHWLALLFAAEIDPTEARNNEPRHIDEIGWFTLDALPEPLHSQIEPYALPALRRY